MTTSHRALPPSITASAVSGWIGGTLTWMLVSGWTDLSSWATSYARLDQLAAMTLGASVGAVVLFVRARHRREPIWVAAAAGVLLGGVSALVGVTLALALLPAPIQPRAFLVVRIGTWAVMAACASGALACFTRVHRRRRIAESVGLGLVGGAVAGSIASLPGAPEVWWPLALAMAGMMIGLASVGPGIWRASAVVLRLPPRDGTLSLWSLWERALDDDWSAPVNDGLVSVVGDDVIVHPPVAGANLDGYPLYRSLALSGDAVLTVGRTRVRITRGPRAAKAALVASASLIALLVPQGTPAPATVEVPWRLVRCAPQRSAACLSATLSVAALPSLSGTPGATPTYTWRGRLGGVDFTGASGRRLIAGTVTAVVGAPMDWHATFATIPAQGTLALTQASRGHTIANGTATAPEADVLRVNTSWYPPRIAAPAFSGVADPLLLPEAIREVLETSDDPPGVRGGIAMVMALVSVLLVFFVPRLAWTFEDDEQPDLARQVAATRASLSAQELETLRGAAPQEVPARRPEEPTSEAFRRPGSDLG